MRHGARAERRKRDYKRHKVEKTRVTRVRSYDELRETGEQKREPSERQNIAKLDIYEEAFELNNLNLLLIIGCCNLLCFDINIHSKIQRAV